MEEIIDKLRDIHNAMFDCSIDEYYRHKMAKTIDKLEDLVNEYDLLLAKYKQLIKLHKRLVE